MKILIAEDDATSRIMLQSALTKWGYQVLAASDGTEAWTILEGKEPPNLAVLDWMMPGLTGVELCRKLRARENTAPLYIILLTSKGERRDIIEGLEAGADDYITKPYDTDELHSRINVGKRMLELQMKLRDKEKMQGVLEMAGAVCHELNQPLQAISGMVELMLMNISESDPQFQKFVEIKGIISQMGKLTKKMMSITTYSSKDYTGTGNCIFDIHGRDKPEDPSSRIV
jgi:CheY-like chemotaxis protein